MLRGRHPLRLRVLEPIPYERFAGMDAEKLTDQVRERIAEELGEARSEPPPVAKTA